jgi:hypothetical protein
MLIIVNIVIGVIKNRLHFLTNINVNFMRCKNDCENIIKDTKKHNKECGSRDYYKNKKSGEIIPVETKLKREKYKK